MLFDELKQGLSSLIDSMTEGWHHLRQSASSALTRFKPGESTNLPEQRHVDDAFYLPTQGWSMLGGDVFEDDQRVVVRLEIPGMNKDDIEIDVQDNALVVRGEKQFEREGSEGRYRVLQCAYGSFRRTFPLRAAVDAGRAQATYRNGVLRVELPKASPSEPVRFNVKVE
jgi:HSP20 family protein